MPKRLEDTKNKKQENAKFLVESDESDEEEEEDGPLKMSVATMSREGGLEIAFDQPTIVPDLLATKEGRVLSVNYVTCPKTNGRKLLGL